MLKALSSNIIVLLLIFISASNAFAVIEIIDFDSAEQEHRYRSLVAELRCLKCQNQNLASSDAPLAKDLRTIASDMIKSGANDQEIKEFMRERYGDFVLYKPPFNLETSFLWLGPIGLLFIVIITIVISVKKRQDRERFTPNSVYSEAERAKVRNLLRDTPHLTEQHNDDPN